MSAHDDWQTAPIESDRDVMLVRKAVRQMAVELGFRFSEVMRTVTAVSELGRNVVRHAGSGAARWRKIERPSQVGVEVVFEDQGPGIANIEDALRDGVTVARGGGLGLSGAKRYMDELVVHFKRNVGTTVVIRMWKS